MNRASAQAEADRRAASASGPPAGSDAFERSQAARFTQPTLAGPQTSAGTYHGPEEVQDILGDYRAELDSASLPEDYLIYLRRHTGKGENDYHFLHGYEADSWAVEGEVLTSAEFGNYMAGYGVGYGSMGGTPENLDLLGIPSWGGVALEIFGFISVRQAGSLYGIQGLLQGQESASWEHVVFLGDDLASFHWNTVGQLHGMRDALGRSPWWLE